MVTVGYGLITTPSIWLKRSYIVCCTQTHHHNKLDATFVFNVRYYAALLRCLHLVLSDPKGSHEEHVRCSLPSKSSSQS